jgi:hypothetical protein
MNANFLRRTPDEVDGVYPAIESLPNVTGQACCCPARPAARVLIPPTAARPHQTELLLCGHDYGASRDALAAAGAVVQHLR